MSEVIMVASGKGGTGKTMFSANLGAVLAQAGFRVVLLDMDMGLRNLDLYLGMENRVVYNIMDVLSGVCRISKAIIRVDGDDELYFMAASPGRDDRDITPLHMRVLCDKLKGVFDFVIIDCPAGIGDLVEASAAAADRAIIVTLPEIAAARDAEVTERFLGSHGVNKTFVVVNRMNYNLQRAGFLPETREIASMFRGSVIGVIQDDDNIRISTNMGIPIVRKHGNQIEQNIRKIVKNIFIK